MGRLAEALDISRVINQLLSRQKSGGKRGMRIASKKLLEAQQANLSGGDGPVHSYPVPERTGDLLAGARGSVQGTLVIIANVSEHAIQVHEGEGNNKVARPFLDDAIDQVDVLGIIGDNAGVAL